MKLSNAVLGIIGMIASPFLWMEMTLFSNAGMKNTSLTGVCDLIYISGWMCSIVALIRLRAAGETKWGRAILFIQLGLLAIADVSNIWAIIEPNSANKLYRVIDMCWPISNGFMIISGIAVIVVKKLKGLTRYITLITGGWFPFTAGIMSLTKGGDVGFYMMNIYALASFFLLGFSIFKLDKQAQTISSGVSYPLVYN